MNIRKRIAFGTLIAVLVLLPAAVFAWGWAVHAYIDDQFSTKWAVRNGNHLYGGFSPDMFLYRFDAPAYRDYLFDKTHTTDFMEVWEEARSVPAKAAAFGFVSHNELWGVDSTAHSMAATPGFTEGYVIAKARVLKGILQPILEANGLYLPAPIVMEISHEFVEYGVDILMKNVDPMIGAKIMAAAAPPNPNIPLVIEKAYAEDLAEHFGIRRVDARQFIRSSELQFRQVMAFYGNALMQDDLTSIYLLAQRIAEIAEAFLAANGIILPPGADITPLAQFGIYQAMVICAPDFGQEVFLTSAYVEQQLAAHNIAY